MQSAVTHGIYEQVEQALEHKKEEKSSKEIATRGDTKMYDVWGNDIRNQQ